MRKGGCARRWRRAATCRSRRSSCCWRSPTTTTTTTDRLRPTHFLERCAIVFSAGACIAFFRAARTDAGGFPLACILTPRAPHRDTPRAKRQSALWMRLKDVSLQDVARLAHALAALRRGGELRGVVAGHVADPLRGEDLLNSRTQRHTHTHTHTTRTPRSTRLAKQRRRRRPHMQKKKKKKVGK